MEGDCRTSSREYCTEILAKLERPMSFIGERRLNFILFGGEWSNVEEIIERASKDRTFRDKARPMLVDRFNEIKEDLRTDPLRKEEAEALFEEGIAIKRAIYLIDRRSMEIDEDKHGDMKRWLKYGRSISI
ncbi:MAG: hypothetical protein ACMUIE_03390 [Thermoplasmatota archaeon]